MMWLGSKRNCKEEVGGVKCKDKLKILGITFSNSNPASSLEENWNERIEKMHSLIKQWSRRNLSISGKICVITSYLISQLVYVLQSLAVPSDVLDKVNRLLFRFLWENKFSNTRAFEKVKRTVLCSPKEMGVLQMINIKDMQKSFRLAWASKLQDPKEDSLKVIPCFLFGQLGQSYACFHSTIQSKKLYRFKSSSISVLASSTDHLARLS